MARKKRKLSRKPWHQEAFTGPTINDDGRWIKLTQADLRLNCYSGNRPKANMSIRMEFHGKASEPVNEYLERMFPGSDMARKVHERRQEHWRLKERQANNEFHRIVLYDGRLTAMCMYFRGNEFYIERVDKVMERVSLSYAYSSGDSARKALKSGRVKWQRTVSTATRHPSPDSES